MVTKQILLVAALLGLVAPISALDASGNNAGFTHQQRAIFTSVGARVDSATREELVKLEKSSWELAKKADVNGMREFYPDDVILLMADGSRMNKAKIISTAKELQIAGYAIQGNMEVMPLTLDAVTLIYRIKVTSKPKGKKKTTDTLQSSSTYVRRAGKWRNVFYQETKLK